MISHSFLRADDCPHRFEGSSGRWQDYRLYLYIRTSYATASARMKEQAQKDLAVAYVARSLKQGLTSLAMEGKCATRLSNFF